MVPFNRFRRLESRFCDREILMQWGLVPANAVSLDEYKAYPTSAQIRQPPQEQSLASDLAQPVAIFFLMVG